MPPPVKAGGESGGACAVESVQTRAAKKACAVDRRRPQFCDRPNCARTAFPSPPLLTFPATRAHTRTYPSLTWSVVSWATRSGGNAIVDSRCWSNWEEGGGRGDGEATRGLRPGLNGSKNCGATRGVAERGSVGRTQCGSNATGELPAAGGAPRRPAAAFPRSRAAQPGRACCGATEVAFSSSRRGAVAGRECTDQVGSGCRRVLLVEGVTHGACPEGARGGAGVGSRPRQGAGALRVRT